MRENASIHELRQQMGDFINTDVTFFDCNHVVLKDTDVVPHKVRVSEVVRTILPGHAFTKRQASEVQDLLLSALGTAEAQKRLNQLERDCNGDARTYRSQLKLFLDSEVYPDICSRFGVQHFGNLIQAIHHHSATDLSMLEAWYVLERLMRNSAAVHMADEAITSLIQSRERSAGAAHAA